MGDPDPGACPLCGRGGDGHACSNVPADVPLIVDHEGLTLRVVVTRRPKPERPKGKPATRRG